MNTPRTSSSGPFGLPKLPARYAAVVMPFFLSIVMTCIISLVSTLRGVGWVPGLLHLWLGSWAISWVIAFPTLLVMLPVVRKLTALVVQAP
jgi:hypothetical protein